ncbi:transcription initiation factor TFIID subunit 4-like [Pollicipes pollicipes]|uniref:transcription initiation factor TFIID subunit 4-like n=1 Tax=Pollicipes pollicipes TaxID=41117 RepID=UPI0018855DC3|nr:transcription initiation factor TFIID subunit 4-like [Pollicipes pollicipes]
MVFCRFLVQQPITLQTIQGLQGSASGHLLFKTENGQLKLIQLPVQGGTTSAAVCYVGTSTTSTPMYKQSPVQAATTPRTAVAVSAAPAVAAPAQPTAQPAQGAMAADTAKLKCKNFLSTLLRLAKDQPDTVERNVRTLIQSLIDARVEPEAFTSRLQQELNSSPQPCLVPFLKKSLPFLRQSLFSRDITIDGVKPPPQSALPPVALRQNKKLNFKSSFESGHDDDINDVAAMGGVNLQEESQHILGSTEYVGTQIRSIKDDTFLPSAALQLKIRRIAMRHGLEEPGPDVVALVSHATQERLKTLLEQLAAIAEHRIEVVKSEPGYEASRDVRGQLRFLEELDKLEQKRHEETEREVLLRAAKSRSKTEDPEQAKLKAKAKEMQRVEMEEVRQREANLTALKAIGPRKKPRLDGESAASDTPTVSGALSQRQIPLRPRLKRVNARDLLFVLEQERGLQRSERLFQLFLK